MVTEQSSTNAVNACGPRRSTPESTVRPGCGWPGSPSGRRLQLGLRSRLRTGSGSAYAVKHTLHYVKLSIHIATPGLRSALLLSPIALLSALRRALPARQSTCRTNPGKRLRKFNSDCTICHSCRRARSDSAALKWPEERDEWRECGNAVLLYSTASTSTPASDWERVTVTDTGKCAALDGAVDSGYRPLNWRRNG